MNLTALSDYQLRSLAANNRLDSTIIGLAKSELLKRGLSDIDAKAPENKEGLSFLNKCLLLLFSPVGLLFPYTFYLLFIIQMYFVSKYLSKGQKRKWREFWLFTCLSFAGWLTGLIFYTRLIL